MAVEGKKTVKTRTSPTKRAGARRDAKPKRTAARRSSTKKSLAPQKLKLLITVVPRQKREFYADFLQSFEVNMQFSVTGSGTASSDIMHMMGLEDAEKRVIFSLIREDRAAAALAALDEKFRTIRNGKGIAMTVPLSGVIGTSIYQFLCNHRSAQREEDPV